LHFINKYPTICNIFKNNDKRQKNKTGEKNQTKINPNYLSTFKLLTQTKAYEKIYFFPGICSSYPTVYTYPGPLVELG
jgi:hypothetical protein